MKRLVYFFVCALMAVSMAAQSLNVSSSFTVQNDDLNRIENGQFVYDIEGVGQFVLSMDKNVSYEYSTTSIWFGKKRHRLVLQAGNGSVTAESFDPSKKIKITGVSLSGFAYSSWGLGSVKVADHSSTWPTDGFDVSPYTTASGTLNCWDACPIETEVKVSVITVKVDYAVYDLVPSVTVSDTESPEKEIRAYAEEIQLDRKLSAGWNTLCLPFDCQVSELGEGVVAQQFVAYDPTTGLNFEIVDHLEANKPYMVYCPTEIPAMTLFFTAREIYGATPQPVSYNGMTFIGNYEPRFSMYGKYGVAQNKLIKGGANAIVNGTRAYFEYADPASQAAFRINYQPMDATTGIGTVQVEQAVPQGVYTLQGVQVRADNNLQGLPAGVYIVNGHKVMVGK